MQTLHQGASAQLWSRFYVMVILQPCQQVKHTESHAQFRVRQLKQLLLMSEFLPAGDCAWLTRPS